MRLHRQHQAAAGKEEEASQEDNIEDEYMKLMEVHKILDKFYGLPGNEYPRYEDLYLGSIDSSDKGENDTKVGGDAKKAVINRTTYKKGDIVWVLSVAQTLHLTFFFNNCTIYLTEEEKKNENREC